MKNKLSPMLRVTIGLFLSVITTGYLAYIVSDIVNLFGVDFLSNITFFEWIGVSMILTTLTFRINSIEKDYLYDKVLDGINENNTIKELKEELEELGKCEEAIEVEKCLSEVLAEKETEADKWGKMLFTKFLFAYVYTFMWGVSYLLYWWFK